MPHPKHPTHIAPINPNLIRPNTWLAHAHQHAHHNKNHPHPTQTPRPYIGRFAPSPSGPLHQGSLITALASYLHAHWHAGQWLVRIEDIDTTRCTRTIGEQQLNTLHQHGFHYPHPVLWQTERHTAYRSEFNRLRQKQLIYPCTCTRTQLAQQTQQHTPNPATPHPHHCPHPNAPIRSWRFNAHNYAHQFGHHSHTWQDESGTQHTQTIDDFVLKRGAEPDNDWAYPFAVVIDDAAQHITHIVRGADLIDATARQIALQNALGYPTPQYNHSPLLLGPNGEKLSKSQQAPELTHMNPLTSLRHAWQHLGGNDFPCNTIEEFWHTIITLNSPKSNIRATSIRNKRQRAKS